MVNFGQLAAEIDPVVWGTPANFNGFRVLAALLHVSQVVRQPNFAALNRGRHLCSAGRPSGSALDHILVIIVIITSDVVLTCVPQSGATVQEMPVSSAVVMSARCEDAAQLSARSSQVPAQNERHLSQTHLTRFHLLTSPSVCHLGFLSCIGSYRIGLPCSIYRRSNCCRAVIQLHRGAHCR